ncbi:unnamed protein product [Lactuca virosa]|uniref:Protein kinase domain-containing protein n=1 Tax=Lactuca virosa TaxID=75947 RepID=A0AAU9N6C5_9ASTR|nr:unnamed protein product [Lactuca virosa]
MRKNNGHFIEECKVIPPLVNTSLLIVCPNSTYQQLAVRNQCRRSIVAPHPPIDAPLFSTRCQTVDAPPHRSFPNSQLHPSPPTSPAVPPSHASDTTIAQQNSDSSSDAKEQNQKAHTHSQELEKQVEKLWLELNLKLRLKEDLETRSKELDQKMIDINPKLQEGHIIGWLQTPDTRTVRQGEKKHYNQKVDAYSFVIVSWELLHNKLPFEGMYNLQATYSAAFKNVRPINQLVISMLRTGGFQTPLKQPEATPCYTPSLGLGIVNTSSLTHQPQPQPQPEALLFAAANTTCKH